MLKWIKNNWLWFILACGFILLHSQHQLDSDEGLVLNAAWNIFNGRILYIDTFEFITPLAPFLIFWWWKITEVSFLSAASLAWLISFSSAIGLYLISRKLQIRRWRFFAPAFFIASSAFWPIINHNAFNMAAIIWSLYFLCSDLTKKSTLIYSGLLAGVAILFLQHKGIVALFISFVWLCYLVFKKTIKPQALLYYTAAALIPVLSLCIWWSPTVLFNNLIVFPLYNYPETNIVPLTLLIISALICLIILGAGFFKKEAINTKQRILVLALGLGLLVGSLARADAAHVFQVLGPLLVLVAYSLEQHLTRSYDRVLVGTWWILCLFALIPRPLFNVSITQNFIAAIRQYCPSGSLYAGPFMPGLYFEMRTKSTTPYSILINKQQSPEQFAIAEQLLQNNPPSCVVLNYETVKKFNYTKNNPVDAFFQERYYEKQRIGNVHILVKK